ncbi:hypothetical protein J0S82_017832, partial [Galemys pyrenaicus]
QSGFQPGHRAAQPNWDPRSITQAEHGLHCQVSVVEVQGHYDNFSQEVFTEVQKFGALVPWRGVHAELSPVPDFQLSGVMLSVGAGGLVKLHASVTCLGTSGSSCVDGNLGSGHPEVPFSHHVA